MGLLMAAIPPFVSYNISKAQVARSGVVSWFTLFSSPLPPTPPEQCFVDRGSVYPLPSPFFHQCCILLTQDVYPMSV